MVILQSKQTKTVNTSNNNNKITSSVSFCNSLTGNVTKEGMAIIKSAIIKSVVTSTVLGGCL